MFSRAYGRDARLCSASQSSFPFLRGFFPSIRRLSNLSLLKATIVLREFRMWIIRYFPPVVLVPQALPSFLSPPKELFLPICLPLDLFDFRRSAVPRKYSLISISSPSWIEDFPSLVFSLVFTKSTFFPYPMLEVLTTAPSVMRLPMPDAFLIAPCFVMRASFLFSVYLRFFFPFRRSFLQDNGLHAALDVKDVRCPW